MDKMTRSLISMQVLAWLAVIVAVLLMMMTGCQVSPSGGGRFGMGAAPTARLWAGGDSISCPTFIRINGVFCIGVNGSGFYREPTVSRQLMDALALYPAPQRFYVITGGNDYLSGVPVSQIISAAQNFHNNVEAAGIDVVFITEPIPDNDFRQWDGLQEYNDWLVATYPDTIDCAYAGHPTEATNSFVPVHPTAQGFDNYAACIGPQLSWEQLISPKTAVQQKVTK